MALEAQIANKQKATKETKSYLFLLNRHSCEINSDAFKTKNIIFKRIPNTIKS